MKHKSVIGWGWVTPRKRPKRLEKKLRRRGYLRHVGRRPRDRSVVDSEIRDRPSVDPRLLIHDSVTATVVSISGEDIRRSREYTRRFETEMAGDAWKNCPAQITVDDL